MTKHHNRRLPVNVTSWAFEPISKDIRNRIQRMAGDEDVVHVAVMPDVHLANEYCIGTVVAARSKIMPQAVGGDIGCGMAAMRICSAADRLNTSDAANRLLRGLGRFVPANKHSAETLPDKFPQELRQISLSESRLSKLAKRVGRYQLGTLGRGNHFLEFQSDQVGSLWLMVHSGSRAMGQAITAHHHQHALTDGVLPYFEDGSITGRNYLNDVRWAREYARQNRLAMLRMTVELLDVLWSVCADESSLIESDHNHVQIEKHGSDELWIHRKGAQSARVGEAGVIPGSMGTSSYHVVGRGCEAALHSSSHGAGRRQSRSEAKRNVTMKSLLREMGDVAFDRKKSIAICDEAPSAYKDIRKVMRAQRDLVKIERELKPIVSYKGV